MNTPESPEIARLQQRLSDLEARFLRYQEMFPGALNRMDELDKEREALRAENVRLRNCILNQRGDDLCHISDLGEAMALPREEFLESCRRYHAQISSNGSFVDGRTIAQLEAENQRLEGERDALRDGLEKLVQELPESEWFDTWIDEKDSPKIKLALSAAQALLSGAAPGGRLPTPTPRPAPQTTISTHGQSRALFRWGTRCGIKRKGGLRP